MRRRDADQHAGTRFAPTTLRVTLSAVLARSHLAGAALLHRRRHGEPVGVPGTASDLALDTAPDGALDTAPDSSTDPSANALDGARAAGAQSLALCAPDTGKDCPSARRAVHVRARTKLGYRAFRTRASNRGACVKRPERRRFHIPSCVGHAVGLRILNLRQMDQEKSPRTQLCVKRLVVLERREFTVGLLTALYISYTGI